MKRPWIHRRNVTHPCSGEADAAVTAPLMGNPLAALLAGHILRDGEVILLLLKPSRWFILLSSLRFLATAGVLAVLILLLRQDVMPYMWGRFMGALILLSAGRLMWASLQWMGRLYILTDLRVLALSGAFTVELFDCPLRKVARISLLRSAKERLFGLGTIEIIPQDETSLMGTWQMVRHPRDVHAQIMSTINRARHGVALQPLQ